MGVVVVVVVVVVFTFALRLVFDPSLSRTRCFFSFTSGVVSTSTWPRRLFLSFACAFNLRRDAPDGTLVASPMLGCVVGFSFGFGGGGGGGGGGVVVVVVVVVVTDDKGTMVGE